MEKLRLLLYCTRQPHKLFNTDKGFVLSDFELGGAFKDKTLLNGKIVAECDFEVEELTPYQYQGLRENMVVGYKGKTTDYNVLIDKSKIGYCELDNYLKCNIGYAIHIKNLNIFDKPRELSQYHRPYGCINISCENKTKQKYLGCSLVRHCKLTQIKNAPQNMMKVESKICDEKDYILISIRLEEMCRLLNGEQTILVRKKVLKEMVK